MNLPKLGPNLAKKQKGAGRGKGPKAFKKPCALTPPSGAGAIPNPGQAPGATGRFD